VEGVGGDAPVGDWIGEGTNNGQELHHRARVPVAYDQREHTRLGRADVQEVDVLAIDRGDELR
jgi:hypothetical protein